jgi:hypothetical protein
VSLGVVEHSALHMTQISMQSLLTRPYSQEVLR